MDLIELAKKVQEARTAQKAYFSNRTVQNLEKSKQLERELDKVVEEIINPTVKNQTSLF